jgi:hypothetical protein
MPQKTPDASQHTRYIKETVCVAENAYGSSYNKGISRNGFNATCFFIKNILPNHISSNKFTSVPPPPCPSDAIFDGGNAWSDFCSLDGNGDTIYDGGNAYKQVCGV